jgi:hypothetical protein
MENTITTFDGVFWDKQDILNQMHRDEFYFGYLGKNALSSSSCKDLLKNPSIYYNSINNKGGGETNDAFRVGNLFHYKLLEPKKWESLHFVDVKSKNTNAYKFAVEEYGEAYTSEERYNAEQMAASFMGNSKASDFLRNARTEVPAIGEIEGIPFRGKADILGGSYIADLKSCSDIRRFKWDSFKFGYEIQCFIYCELFGISYKDFTFIAVDKSTHLVGIFECSKEFYYRGEEKTMEAIQIYKDFFIDKKKPVEDFYLYDVL